MKEVAYANSQVFQNRWRASRTPFFGSAHAEIGFGPFFRQILLFLLVLQFLLKLLQLQMLVRMRIGRSAFKLLE